jgi:uncharacterized coiled-coil DUF342 family protein
MAGKHQPLTELEELRQEVKASTKAFEVVCDHARDLRDQVDALKQERDELLAKLSKQDAKLIDYSQTIFENEQSMRHTAEALRAANHQVAILRDIILAALKR